MEDPSQLIEDISAYGFPETLSRLERAIADASLKLFARIDHAQGAREFGLEMSPTVVLLFGHPRGGTPIMLEHPDAAIDLPLRLLVRENADGRTTVLYRPIDTVLAVYRVPTDQALKLAPAQQRVAAAVSAPAPVA